MNCEEQVRDELYHHGILGMKWGVKRYQNKDGTLTAAGKRRQQIIDSSREEGLRVAKEQGLAKKKGESVATTLVLAERKARENGEVDKSFLNNEHISQKAKDRVLSIASKTASKQKSEGSEDYQKSKEMLKRGAKNLSTKELKDLTTRLQLEKQYQNLNPSDTKKGLDAVKKITAAGTTITTLYALTKTPLGKDVTSAITSAVKDAGLKRAYKMAMGG